MDQDDPEKRIAELERQLAELKRDADLPPAKLDHAAASRRFVARGLGPPAWYHVYWVGSFAALFALMYKAPAALGKTTGWVVVLLSAGGLALLGFLAILRWGAYKKFPICVTSDGLTVDKKPGDVFSFDDAKLGLWTPGGYISTMSGTALHLRSGPHPFVLGGRDHRVSTTTRLEAPATGRVDGWLRAADFDEVLSIVARRSGLDVRGPAPGEPIRCLLFPRPSYRPYAGPVRSLQKPNPQPSLAIDVGTDAVWVIDPKNNALIASGWLAQVTATPADYLYYWKGEYTTPVLVVSVPGLQPLTIGCPLSRVSWQSRFSWRGEVPSEKQPVFIVSAADWLVLVEKFGLAPYLHQPRQWGDD